MPTIARITIRGMDVQLYHQARLAAFKAGIPIGKWVNEAIASYLKKTVGEVDR